MDTGSFAFSHAAPASGTSSGCPSAPGLDDLTALNIEELLPLQARAVFVAPNPGDEVLGTGGLMATLYESGRELLLIAVTDGTASHANSPYWSIEKLARVRPRETGLALARLGMSRTAILRLGLQDGGIARQKKELRRSLEAALRPGDVVFVPWCYDGNSDCEAVFQAASTAAKAVGARLVEVPIRTWARPVTDPLPWDRARRFALPEHIAVRKKSAVRAFRSQLEPDRSAGTGPVMSAGAAGQYMRDFEILFL